MKVYKKWADIKRTPTQCKRRTDIPPERDWSTPTKCERGTVWEGEWRWVSYRAYSVNLCLSENQLVCDDLPSTLL